MFEDSLFESGGRIRPRCGLAIATSLALQSLLLATLVLLPLFWERGATRASADLEGTGDVFPAAAFRIARNARCKNLCE